MDLALHGPCDAQVADPSEHQMMTPKTLLDCCRCAQEFDGEHALADGLDVRELTITRTIGHRTKALTQLEVLMEASKNKDEECYLLSLVNLLRLVCCVAKEAGLESVLFAAFSLKYEIDVKRSFSILAEAMDKAKSMRLSPDECKEVYP